MLIYNPSTWEVEAGISESHSKLETTWATKDPVTKINKNKFKKKT